MEDISEVTIPADAVTDQMVVVGQEYMREDGSIGSVLNELILGRMVNTAVYAGEYVTPNALIKPEDVDPFKVMDLSGYRKYAISTNPVDAIGGNIEAGDVVDLIITVRGNTVDEEGKAKSWTYSKVFMENVLIYKVLTSDGQDYIDHIEHEDALYSVPATIILAVTPAQIEEIKSRESLGTISFIGRFAESEDAESEGFSVVVGQDGIEFIPDNSFELPY
jgi:pilus assembly protein CpaB